MPQISVIVPIYNAEKYLPRCIDSILAQEFSDFELILVDDGSSDKSGVICDEYAKTDGRICVIHQSNGGVSSARNAALSTVSGKYIMFADGDDYVDPRWCSRLYETIERNPEAWINSNIWMIDVQGNARMRLAVENTSYCGPTTVFGLTSTLCGSLCNSIYSTEIIRREHIRFNERYRIGEDTDFNMQYYRHCKGTILIAEPLYYYCANDTSALHEYKYDSFDLHRHAFMDRLPFIEAEYLNEYFDDWLWRFLKMLDDAFDPRNHLSFWQKMRYNHRMMHTPEFIYCVEHATEKNNGELLLRVLKTSNYYLYWLFQRAVRLKATMRKRLRGGQI